MISAGLHHPLSSTAAGGPSERSDRPSRCRRAWFGFGMQRPERQASEQKKKNHVLLEDGHNTNLGTGVVCWEHKLLVIGGVHQKRQSDAGVLLVLEIENANDWAFRPSSCAPAQVPWGVWKVARARPRSLGRFSLRHFPTSKPWKKVMCDRLRFLNSFIC